MSEVVSLERSARTRTFMSRTPQLTPVMPMPLLPGAEGEVEAAGPPVDGGESRAFVAGGGGGPGGVGPAAADVGGAGVRLARARAGAPDAARPLPVFDGAFAVVADAFGQPVVPA